VEGMEAVPEVDLVGVVLLEVVGAVVAVVEAASWLPVEANLGAVWTSALLRTFWLAVEGAALRWKWEAAMLLSRPPRGRN
jgi:hypothetical protein